MSFQCECIIKSLYYLLTENYFFVLVQPSLSMQWTIFSYFRKSCYIDYNLITCNKILFINIIFMSSSSSTSRIVLRLNDWAASIILCCSVVTCFTLEIQNYHLLLVQSTKLLYSNNITSKYMYKLTKYLFVFKNSVIKNKVDLKQLRESYIRFYLHCTHVL